MKTRHSGSSGTRTQFDASRILVDSPEAQAVFDKEILARMGHVILACHGPDSSTMCPILEARCVRSLRRAIAILSTVPMA